MCDSWFASKIIFLYDELLKKVQYGGIRNITFVSTPLLLILMLLLLIVLLLMLLVLLLMLLVLLLILLIVLQKCQPFYVLQQTEDMSGSSIIVIVYNIYISTVYTNK
jgi:hypothetical protein